MAPLFYFVLSSLPLSVPPFLSLSLPLLPPPSLFPQHPLWHRLIKDYQDLGLLVEGPLNNLRRNEMHLPKPSKLYNKRNPVRHAVFIA